MRLLLLLLLIPLAAQDVRVIHLSPADAKILAQIGNAKLQADENWRQAEKYVRWKYAAEPGIAQAGDAQVDVKNPRNGWEYGVQFSQDFSVIVPKPKPCEDDEH
jgi:hypothetical protein